MKGNVLKRVLAVVTAGAMVLGGVNIPALDAEAANHHNEWNTDESPSSYPKVPIGQFTITADSQCNGAEGRDGPAAHAVDGKIGTYWHSNYNNDHQADLANGVDNTATLVLAEPQDVAGITYLPRSGLGNGTIYKISIQVQQDGSDTWEDVFDNRTDGTWSFSGQEEKEVIFSEVKANVKYIKIAVHDALANFISAAEFSILKPRTVSVWNENTSPSGWEKLPREDFDIAADSEEGKDSDGNIQAAKDGVASTYWHSAYDEDGLSPVPTIRESDGEFLSGNTVTMTLKERQNIKGITYLPRQGSGPNNSNGYVEVYSVSISRQEEGEDFTEVISRGHCAYADDESGWNESVREREILFPADQFGVKRIRFTVHKTMNSGGNHINAAEFSILKGTYTYEAPAEIQIASYTLMKNAKANSSQQSEGNVEYAFNENSGNYWHSSYGDPVPGMDHDGVASPENPVWIQTGFNRRLFVTALTYQPRSNGHNIIHDYQVQVADMGNPADEPQDEDFKTVKSGALEALQTEQRIQLESPVRATHLRLVATSVHAVDGNGDGHVTASNIKIYEKPVQPPVDLEVLKQYSQANSWYAASNDTDGGPVNAFDGNIETLWHSNYGESSPQNVEGSVSEENPIWIQAAFGSSVPVKRITYRSRKTGANAIYDYDLYLANLEDPYATATDEDFGYGEEGTPYRKISGQFADDGSGCIQEILLPELVMATHFRLVAKSETGSSINDYITASEIRVYTGVSEKKTVAEYDDLPVLSIVKPETGQEPQNAVHKGNSPKFSLQTVWKDEEESEITAPQTFELGKAYTVEMTLTPEEGYQFTELSLPETILIGEEKAELQQGEAVLNEDGSMTVTHKFDVYEYYKETQFWDTEIKDGNMAEQTDLDYWHYQVKKSDSGEWEDLPQDAFHAGSTIDGTGSWMQETGSPTGAYHYGKITKTQITATFAGGTYVGAAYAFRVPEKGYYRATLEEPMEDSKGFRFLATHAPAATPETDGKTLIAEKVYNGSQMLDESRVARAEAGDYIRFAVLEKWATGFKPMIEEATVLDYAKQYLQDVEAMDISSILLTPETKEAAESAKEELQRLVTENESVEEPDEVALEEAVDTLEDAVAALETADTLRYENNGKTGTKEVTDERESNVFRYMKHLSIDVMYKINADAQPENSVAALATFVGKNGKFFTVYHNPVDGLVGHSVTAGNSLSNGFFSKKTADTPGTWEKETYCFVETGENSYKYTAYRNGVLQQQEFDYTAANGYGPWIADFMADLRQGNISQVLLGQKTDAEIHLNDSLGSVRNFDDEKAILKFVKIRNSNAGAAVDTLLTDEQVEQEYNAALAEAEGIHEQGQKEYTNASWNAFEAALEEARNKTTDWDRMNAVDSLAEAESALIQLTVEAGYVNGCGPEMGTVTKEISEDKSQITFRAEPGPAYEFVGWYSDQAGQEEVEGTEELVYTIQPEDTEVHRYAKFEKKTFTVTAGIVNNEESKGSLDQSEVTVEYGQSAVFKATPEAGYTVEGWYSDSTGNTKLTEEEADITVEDGNISVCTINNVQEAKAVYVKFVVDKTALDALLEKCSKLNAAEYTKASWDAYTAVYGQARQVSEDPAATVENVADAVSKLTVASTVGTGESGLRRYQPLSEVQPQITVVDDPVGEEGIVSRESGMLYAGGDNDAEIKANSLQVKLGKDYYKDDLKIEWSAENSKIHVQAIKDYPSRATLDVDPGAVGTIKVTVTTTNGNNESSQATVSCQVEVGYEVMTDYVAGSEGKGSANFKLQYAGGGDSTGELLLASAKDQAVLTANPAEGYVLKGWYKDSEGQDAWDDSYPEQYTYRGSENSNTDADEKGVITFYAKFVADKSGLAGQIEEAKARMDEADYETKYTQESRDALDKAYQEAQRVNVEEDPTKDTVQKAAQELKDAIAGLTEQPKETLSLTLEVSKTDSKELMGTLQYDGAEWTDGDTRDGFEVDQEVTVKAVANEGYEFQYWENLNGNKVVSEAEEYTFNIFSHMKLCAVFKEIDTVTYTVEFKTSDKFANQVVSRQVLTVSKEGDTATAEVPQPLSYFDYQFKGWALEGSDTVTIQPSLGTSSIGVTKDTTYIAVYEPKDDGKLSVTIKGDTGSITSGNQNEENRYTLDTLLAVTAKAPEGKPYFEGWYLSDGTKVSSNLVYKFYVKKNMELEAKFSEKPIDNSQPVVTFTTSRTVKADATTKDACKLQLTWDAPEGCTIVTQGVMRMYGKTGKRSEEELAAADKVMFYGTTNKDVTVNNYNSTKWSGVYTYNLTIGSAEKKELTLYTRGYVVYKDKSGQQKVLYTEVHALEKIESR